MQIQPYLFFEGKCEEAVNFYRKAIGAEVDMMMRYNQCPDPQHAGPPGAGEKIMHMSFRVGDSTILASDGRCEGKPNFQGISLTLIVSDDAQADRYFTALSDGGKVHMPLGKTFFSPKFGMLADRFGVSWMIYVGP